MDWWMWVIYILVGLGVVTFLASIIAPIFSPGTSNEKPKNMQYLN